MVNATTITRANIPMVSIQVPTVGRPGWDAFPAGSATRAFLFDATSDECGYASFQLPHAYKLGTAISAHVHWAPTNTDTGNVVWQIDYTVANIGGTFGASQQLYIQQAGSGVAYKQQKANFTSIACAACGISSVFIATLCRDADGTNATDDYNADAVLVGFDLHIQLDTLGSREQGTK